MKQAIKFLFLCSIFVFFTTAAYATNYVEDPEHEVPNIEEDQTGSSANLYGNPNTEDTSEIPTVLGLLVVSAGFIGYYKIRKTSVK